MRYLYELVFALLWWVNVNVPIFLSNTVTLFEKYGYIWFLKLPAILADVGLGLWIYYLAKRIRLPNPVLPTTLFLFNPISWYISVVWGQTDSILVLLGLSAVILFLDKKEILGGIIFAVTLMFKATLIIFTPIILMILWRNHTSLKRILLSFLGFLATVWLISKPFSVGYTFSWLFTLYTKTIVTGELHLLSANAFNFWRLIFGRTQIEDSLSILGIPAFFLGIILFGFLVVIVIKKIPENLSLKDVLLSMVLITFSAFLFLTRMHERYIYPIFIPLSILAFTERRMMKIYVLLSTLHLLNMYNDWWVPRIPILINFVSLDPVQRVISFCFLSIFFWLLLRNRNFKFP